MAHCSSEIPKETLMEQYDVTVIGGGPAGLAATTSAYHQGARTLLIEREGKLGGILKQCIHDGFGLSRFKNKLTGPEYAEKEIEKLSQTSVSVSLLTFVSSIMKKDDLFFLELITREGIRTITSKKLILATGCRERTSRQVFIQGTNPSGVFTAGTAQYYINILGKMPTKTCVILGSGDIGLIMARRITLEGGKVEGVYEIKPTPSGLTRNVVQCLNDFEIPLHLSHTVTRVFGTDRLEAVEVAEVDSKMKPIETTKRTIPCDALILSVGLIPENEIAESLHVQINPKTKGPFCDQNLMTNEEGIYCCGNALHVNDLADFVSETGDLAGISASSKVNSIRDLLEVSTDSNFLYIVPSHLDLNGNLSNVIFYFRSVAELKNKKVLLMINGKLFAKRVFSHLRPPEMEKWMVDLSHVGKITSISFGMED